VTVGEELIAGSVSKTWRSAGCHHYNRCRADVRDRQVLQVGPWPGGAGSNGWGSLAPPWAQHYWPLWFGRRSQIRTCLRHMWGRFQSGGTSAPPFRFSRAPTSGA